MIHLKQPKQQLCNAFRATMPTFVELGGEGGHLRYAGCWYLRIEKFRSALEMHHSYLVSFEK